LTEREDVQDHDWEEAAGLSDHDDHNGARRLLAQLLRRRPDYFLGLRLLSEIEHADGHVAQAVAVARRAVDAAPDNLYALGHLCRTLMLCGRPDEARTLAAQILASPVIEDDRWLMQLDLCSYLGNDQAALDAYEHLHSRGLLDEGPRGEGTMLPPGRRRRRAVGPPRRSTRVVAARSEIDPDLEIAQANLFDLRPPARQARRAVGVRDRRLAGRAYAEDMDRQLERAVAHDDLGSAARRGACCARGRTWPAWSRYCSIAATRPRANWL
jgi:tetratricopeptide (TPR) repeat protein